MNCISCWWISNRSTACEVQSPLIDVVGHSAAHSITSLPRPQSIPQELESITYISVVLLKHFIIDSPYGEKNGNWKSDVSDAAPGDAPPNPRWPSSQPSSQCRFQSQAQNLLIILSPLQAISKFPRCSKFIKGERVRNFNFNCKILFFLFISSPTLILSLKSLVYNINPQIEFAESKSREKMDPNQSLTVQYFSTIIQFFIDTFQLLPLLCTWNRLFFLKYYSVDCLKFRFWTENTQKRICSP